MPVPKVAPPKPRPGQRRRSVFSGGRLEALGSPAPASLRASTPIPGRAPTPLAQPRPRAKPLCPNPDCPDRSRVTRTDQGLICESCGALLQEDSGLVSEQGFGETESGRIVATGVQVSQDQTHQRNYLTGGTATGLAGREQPLSHERTRMQARNIMASYVPIFGLQTGDVDRGMTVFSMATRHGFLTGRTIETVAVLSFYIGCRRRKEQVQGVQRPVYGLMLIDFAEKLNMDVFKLGKIYSELYKRIYQVEGHPGVWQKEEYSADFQGMDPSVLVPKFVKELEFDKHDEPKIQYDAIQIIKRMKRDWIHHGRRPSGVCGAAVLLAARMNNYRRTTREVVLTAKVTEITLNKRLQEFHDTQVSNLSVTKFGEEAKVWDKLKDGEHWLDEDLPPVSKERLLPKVKKKRGRPRKHPLPETAAEIEGDTATTVPQISNDGQPPPAKRARIDAEGYKIPDIPARRTGGDASNSTDDVSSNAQVEGSIPEPSQSEDRSTPEVTAIDQDPPIEHAPPTPAGDSEGEDPKSDKRPEQAAWQPPPMLADEIALENAIEAAFDDTLDENRELSDQFGVQQASRARISVTPSPAPETSDEQRAHPAQQQDHQPGPTEYDHDPTLSVPQHRKDKILGPPVNTSIGNIGFVSMDPTLEADEFDTDEDVSTCNLTEEETRIKERVWVAMNADWLRKNHTKRIKKELMEAEMRAKGLDPAEEEKKKKAKKGTKKDGTKRPGRIGDVSYLKGQKKKRKAPVGEGDLEGEDVDTDGDDAEPGEPATAAKSVRSMLEARGTFSRRINYHALEAIYGKSATSEDSAESRSATGEDRSRSGSLAILENERQGSRESSTAGPSASARSTITTPAKPAAIFKTNQGRANRAAIAGERRRTRQILAAQKQAQGEGKSASRSRSRSTPTSAASGQLTPETRSGGQPQTQAQTTLPSPPATQQGSQIPSISTTASTSMSTPAVIPSGSQIPGIKTTASPSIPPASQRGPQTSATNPTSTPESSDEDDEEMEDTGEDEGEGKDDDDDSENEDDAATKEAEEDLDAMFEGRYEGGEVVGEQGEDADDGGVKE